MNVLVDTSVWSLALRRRRVSRDLAVSELAELIKEGRVAVIGAIRQELLSGISDPKQFVLLRDSLRAFPDLPIDSKDHEEAATFFNQCRARGIQGSNTDFLMCAVAVRRKLGIFTTDGDFQHFARLLPIQIHSSRKPSATSSAPAVVNPRLR